MANFLSPFGGGSLSPLDEMRRMQREMDRMFDQFFRGALGSGEAAGEVGLPMACDVRETDSHILCSVDLPGVKKEDIHVDVRDNILTVSGERREEREEGGEGRQFRERRFGRFRRSFRLPAGVDEGNIEAGFENGVLTVAIPRGQQTEGRQIEVREGPLSLSEQSKAEGDRAASSEGKAA